jgi:hypothetical protein
MWPGMNALRGKQIFQSFVNSDSQGVKKRLIWVAVGRLLSLRPPEGRHNEIDCLCLSRHILGRRLGWFFVWKRSIWISIGWPEQ